MYFIVECVHSLNVQVSTLVGGEGNAAIMVASQTHQVLAAGHHSGTISVLETDEVCGSNWCDQWPLSDPTKSTPALKQ